LALAVLRWWRLADVSRRARFSLMPLLGTAFWACLLSLFWQEKLGAIALVLAAAIVQLASPWEPQPPPLPVRRARWRYPRCGRWASHEPLRERGEVGNGAY